MNRTIDERVRDEPGRGRVAPHHLKSDGMGHASGNACRGTKRLRPKSWRAIDHIRQPLIARWLRRNETEVDIFTNGLSVDPTFGEFEAELQRRDLELNSAGRDWRPQKKHPK